MIQTMTLLDWMPFFKKPISRILKSACILRTEFRDMHTWIEKFRHPACKIWHKRTLWLLFPHGVCKLESWFAPMMYWPQQNAPFLCKVINSVKNRWISFPTLVFCEWCARKIISGYEVSVKMLLLHELTSEIKDLCAPSVLKHYLAHCQLKNIDVLG